MNEYDLEYIDKLRIHELRDFARKLGVNSPTTMKKDELISRISIIIEGDTLSIDNSQKYIKNYNDVDFFQLLMTNNNNILESLLNKNSEKTQSGSKIKDANKSNTIIMKKKSTNDNTSYSTNDIVGFSFSLRQNEAKYGDNVDYYDVEGYIDIHPNGYGILRNNGYVPSSKDSYFSSSLLRKHNLKKGLYVYGKAKYIMDSKPRVVYEINKIEESTKVKSTQDFDEMECNGLGEEYYLDKFQLACRRGERHYIENMTLKDAVDLGFELVDENGVNVKLINIKALPEEQYSSHQKMEVINVLFNKSEAEVINTVQLVLERIKREIEYGKSNVLMIYNFSDLIRMFNIVAFDGVLDFNKFNTSIINKINNILYIAKFVDSRVNSSVICIDKNGIATDLKTLIELEFAPLFNQMHKNIERK